MLIPWQIQVLARTVWMEARNQGDVGMIAVAWVIRNRLQTGRWGNDPASVCFWSEQFSCWNATMRDSKGNIANNANRIAGVKLPDNDPDLGKISRLLNQIENGIIPDPTGGAIYYHASSVRPDWADEKYFTTEIGTHLFYREPMRT